MSKNQLSHSPPWQPTTKALVGVTILVIVAAISVRFQNVLGMLVVAAIITFLMTPLVGWLEKYARLTWTAATNISFLFLLLFLVVSSTAAGLAVVQQLQALIQSTQGVLSEIPEQIEPVGPRLLEIGPWTIDLSEFDPSALVEQALSYVEPVFARASSLIAGLATVAVETIARILFILVVAYFLTLDNVRFRRAWSTFSIPGYEADFDRLRIALARLWHSFLRGQLLVVAIVGTLTWILMSVLGLRFSLGLGVLAGIAKFVPIVGPTIAGTIAALVALFQPTNWLGIDPVAHMLLVGLSVILLDQSIDYLVVPRIFGSSLNLHPVIVIIGTIVGATLAGVLGLLLSAPAMATLILLGRYVFRKIFDQSPWDPPIDTLPEIPERSLSKLLRRTKRIVEEAKET